MGRDEGFFRNTPELELVQTYRENLMAVNIERPRVEVGGPLRQIVPLTLVYRRLGSDRGWRTLCVLLFKAINLEQLGFSARIEKRMLGNIATAQVHPNKR